MNEELDLGGKPAPLKKVGSMQVIDIETGEVIEERQNVMQMLPAPPGTCAECAVKHDHDQPHNKQSLFYQYRFRSTHGRWPTWSDAMAHCTPEMQAEWREHLIRVMKKNKMPVPEDLMEAKPAGR